MINQLNLSDIRAFVVISQQQNFGKAAHILGVSRSHVSRQLSALEQAMGVTLLQRTTRTQQLTTAGKQFLTECEQVLDHLEHAALAAATGNQTMQGHIRINCVGGFIGEQIIAPLIAQFMAQHEAITIELDFSSHRVDLLVDQYDLVFRMGQIPTGDFVAKVLGEINMVTLASPHYLAKYGTPTSPHDLAQPSTHRCIVGSVNTWHYQNKNSKVDINVTPNLKCKNGEVMVQQAKAGLGIIRVPGIYCQDAIQQKELVPLFTDWRIPRVPLSLLYHQDKYRPERIKAFIEFVTTHFAAF